MALLVATIRAVRCDTQQSRCAEHGAIANLNLSSLSDLARTLFASLLAEPRAALALAVAALLSLLEVEGCAIHAVLSAAAAMAACPVEPLAEASPSPADRDVARSRGIVPVIENKASTHWRFDGNHFRKGRYWRAPHHWTFDGGPRVPRIGSVNLLFALR